MFRGDSKMTYAQQVLLLYERIDQLVEEHYQNNRYRKKLPCKKGCDECCHQFFEVSEVEFYIILKHLSTWNKRHIERITNKANKLMVHIKQNNPVFFNRMICTDGATIDSFVNHSRNPYRFKLKMPCVFLGAKGTCLIYDVRPIICRTTGTTSLDGAYLHRTCSKIGIKLFAKRWQAALASLRNEIERINIFHPPFLQTPFILKQYPLFVFLSGKKDIFKDPNLGLYHENSYEEIGRILAGKFNKASQYT